MNKSKRVGAGVTALMVMFLAGCAVSPDPLDLETVNENAQESVDAIENNAPAVEGALSSDEAVAYALLYNLDRHVKSMQAALARGQLSAANYDMLPSLTAQAGYTTRSEFSATESVPFIDDEPVDAGGPSNFSVSQEKTRYNYGVDFTWSVLDFGLSYVRAKQRANEYLIAVEDERKVMQNLAQEVRSTYWRSVSADRLLDKVEPLMQRVGSALANSREISRNRLSDPLNNFSYERSLLDVQRSLESLRSELVGAKERLASLMGLPPNTPLELEDFDSRSQSLPRAALDLDTMERTALLLRPEVLTADYRERIARDDVKAALLQMFPDLSFTAGYQYDSNDFLRFNDWASAGAAVSYDLFNVFKANARREAAKTGVEVARQQRMAASLAVITQVHLATLKYQDAINNLNTAGQYLDVSRNIAGLVERQSSAGGTGQLTVIKEQLNALVAELRRDLAYADIQNAMARIYQSMGLDLYSESSADTPKALAEQIKARRQSWIDGDIAVTVKPISQQTPVLEAHGPQTPATFQFDADTFALADITQYRFTTRNGQGLPDWLTFNPATRTFTAVRPTQAQPVAIEIRAENMAGVYATDRFVLRPSWSTSANSGSAQAANTGA